MQNKTTTFAEEINQAQHCAMAEDDSMICMGLGINDPKAIFGTTTGLQSKFGSDRVFDMPTSENAMTGVGIGAAITGTRVLMTHQRVDFFLLAMDQLVNNAAKWHYMFNGQMTVPLTIRLIIGRGWGQGPTHQQSLQSWFAHIPGLKVVTPSLTDNAGQLLYHAIMDDNPTIFLEHRWLHNQVTTKEKCLPFLSPPELTRIVRSGNNFTIISNSFMISEALQAHSHLLSYGIECEVIEISSPTDINWTLIFESIRKTKRCVITEIGHTFCSVASEISHQIYSECYTLLKCPISVVGLPHHPEPTSYGLTKNYYPDANILSNRIVNELGINIASIPPSEHHDIPGEWFKGPF